MGEREAPGVEGRWYEFEQVEFLVRPFWVQASSLEEARQMVREGGVVTDGVPDIAPDGPDDMKIRGRGRWVRDEGTIELIEARQAEW